MNDFLKTEGAACVVSDAGKPQGLLVTTGSWGRGDRAAAQDGIPSVFMAHEHYALLYRLASREKEVTRVEVEISNKFIPGPITVLQHRRRSSRQREAGRVRHPRRAPRLVGPRDQGTTDNGTGSCVVLEAAHDRVLARTAQRPKRTIRFCPLHRRGAGLVRLARLRREAQGRAARSISVALVHDTGTGKVTGFGLEGRGYLKAMLEKELVSLKELDGWKGLTLGGIGGGTDHWSFDRAGRAGLRLQPGHGRLPAHAPLAERHPRQGERAEPDPRGPGDGRDRDARRQPTGAAAAKVTRSAGMTNAPIMPRQGRMEDRDARHAPGFFPLSLVGHSSVFGKLDDKEASSFSWEGYP